MIKKIQLKNQILKKFKFNNKDYKIVKFRYDEEVFGNMWIKMKYRRKIILDYFKDRGDLYAKITYFEKEFFVDDFFSALDIRDKIESKNFESMVISINDILKRNEEKISSAFRKYDEELVKTIQWKIKARIEKLFD